MQIQDGKITLRTDPFPTDGFTFLIYGPIPPGGTEPATRSQGENPVFTRDQAGNYFQSGVVYLLEAEHPDFMPDAEIIRVVFDENGGYTTLSPGENTGTGGGGSGGGGDQFVDLQIATTNGKVTTKDITTNGYGRLPFNATGAPGAPAIWVEQPGGNWTIERGGGVVAPVTAVYALGIISNTCNVVSGYIFDQHSPNVPASFKLYIDNNLIATVEATQSLPSISSQFGLTNTTNHIYGWSLNIPSSYQDNVVHTIECRHLTTGVSLATIYSPGNCGIQVAPQPTFNIRGYYEENAAQPGQNPYPTVVAPKGDQPVTAYGDAYIYFGPNEFSDPGDFLTYNCTGWDSTKVIDFPAGIVYNPDTQTLFVPGTVPNGTSFLFRRSATDTAGQPAAYVRLLSINRPVGPAPVYVVKKSLKGTVKLYEGGAGGVWWIEQEFSNGEIKNYTGGGTPNWIGGYPNGAFVSFYVPGTGQWTAQIPANTLESTVMLSMGYTFPDGSTVTPLPVEAVDQTVTNRAPVLHLPRQFNTVVAGQSLNLAFNAGPNSQGVFQWSDPDGHTITYSLEISYNGGNTYTTALPGWLTINQAGTHYGGTPPAVATTLKLKTIANDGHGGITVDFHNLIIGLAN